MKKYIAIFGLLALLLTGCSDTQETAGTTESVTTGAVVTELPEQIITAEQSTLTGSWSATLNKGAYAASIYFQDAENAQEMEELFKDVQYPFTVQLELREDGSYLLDIRDDGTAFDTFVTSFYGIVSANQLDDCTEEELRQKLTDARMDYLYAEVNFAQDGAWEHNDQGLVFTNWCTVQFTQDGETLIWNSIDDPDFANNLPLTFQKVTALQ